MVSLSTTARGFTLIEMLVSLALFTVVAVIAVGTLLSLIGNNSQIVGDQAVMTSLSFALDSMTREIRTGSEYYCFSATTLASTSYSASDIRNCNNINGFSFREAGISLTGGNDNNRIAYYLDNNKIIRKVGNSTYESLLSNDIKVTGLRFSVTGARQLTSTTSADIAQPMVTIVIDAQAASGTNQKPFTVQTTVTQRPLDI